MYIRLHYNVEVILHYAVLHYIMYEIQHSYNIIFFDGSSLSICTYCFYYDDDDDDAVG